MIIGNRDVKSTGKSLDSSSLEESFKEMQKDEDRGSVDSNIERQLSSSPPRLSLGTPLSPVPGLIVVLCLQHASHRCRVGLDPMAACACVCVCAGSRERKSTWIKPKTTYCKDVDIFRSAVDDRNQFNGEWFTQIQLTVKKEMAWINDGTTPRNTAVCLSLRWC
jgi:hypothetical protein